MRHHLTSLRTEGLATAEEERNGVGRPRLVHFLIEKVLERFTTGYLRLTDRLLDQLKVAMSVALAGGVDHSHRDLRSSSSSYIGENQSNFEAVYIFLRIIGRRFFGFF